jgi:hypothetical protein
MMQEISGWVCRWMNPPLAPPRRGTAACMREVQLPSLEGLGVGFVESFGSGFQLVSTAH